MVDMSVDPDSLQRTASELDELASDLDGIVGSFVRSLNQFGDPWGTDTLGALIGGGYVAIEQLAIEPLNSIVDRIDDYVGGLESMARSYRDVENTNITSFDRLTRQM
jgi:hypothetical protein